MRGGSAATAWPALLAALALVAGVAVTPATARGFSLAMDAELMPTCRTMPPAGCECSFNDKHLFECAGGQRTTTWNDRSEAEISCEGSRELNCSLVPAANMSRTGVLTRLQVTGCGVAAGALACAVRRLGGGAALEELTLQDLPAPLSEDALDGLHKEAMVKLKINRASAQTSLPVEVLRQLPQLVQFRLSNAGRVTLRPNMFANVSASLSFLELSVTTIERIPADAFQGLTGLKSFIIFKNNIKEIDKDAFRGLGALTLLAITGNPELSTLPRGMLQSTAQLQILDLLRNGLLRLDEGVVSGLQRLGELNIESESTLELAARALSDLPALRKLNLKNSQLTALPPDLFQGTNGIHNLDLSSNNLTWVSPETLAPLTSLQTIVLDYNQLQELTERLFYGLRDITLISAAHNNLSTVSWDTFGDHSPLRELDLSFNQLAWGDKSGFSSPLNKLQQLERLYLSHNRISGIAEDWRFALLQLSRLDLSHNRIVNLDSASVQFLSNSHVSVDLRDNRIVHVEPPAETQESADFRLDRNPFQCDCTLLPLVVDMRRRPAIYSENDQSNKQDVRCASPTTLATQSLRDLAHSDLICHLPSNDDQTERHEFAPRGCVCLFRPAERRIECTCSGADLTLLPVPTLISQRADYVALTLTIAQSLVGLPHFVKHLDLSGLGLTEVPHIPRTLSSVNLTRNRLTSVPLELLQRSNTTLWLADNLFECSCARRELVGALIKHRASVKDGPELRCAGEGGGPLMQQSPAHLCDVQVGSLVGGVLAALGVLAAIAAVVYFRWAPELKVYLYKLGCVWAVSEERLDADKRWDVFVSYNHADVVWVRDQLLPRLEPRYRVCEHSRDWEVGCLVEDQIYRSVFESRRTLIVFSRHYLESLFTRLEFRAAYTAGLRDGRVRAVLVLLEEVDVSSLPDDIRTFMSMATFVKAWEPRFWERLMLALPRAPDAAQERARRTAKRANQALAPARAGGGKPGALDVVINDEGKLVNAGFVDSK